ncbi:MAG: 50S ribosomal protein L14 [Candidatus Aenigmatarchaeota archaeon]
MKAISARVTRAINVGAIIECADNTGAKKLQVIAVKGYKGVRKRIPKAGVGDIVICSVKKGDEKLKKQVVYAIIIRQRKEYRRLSGERVKFEDNAAVLINPANMEPQGTEIRSVVAREAVERISSVGKIATIVL